VPHDVRGLIERLGGDKAFTAGLTISLTETLRSTNEEDFGPYLYIHAGRPDRTADRVRALLKDAYNESRGGLPATTIQERCHPGMFGGRLALPQRRPGFLLHRESCVPARSIDLARAKFHHRCAGKLEAIVTSKSGAERKP